MAEEDREKTAFITPWRTFCYRVIQFGLKNAEVTYQQTMTTLFHDMILKEMEVYVDNIIIKSKKVEDHLVDLKKLFERLRKYNLKLNPAKCAFGAPASKLFGLIVSKKGIEIDLAKIKKAIKGQALADHLAENSREDDYQSLHTYFSDEKILFDGASEDMNEQCPGWNKSCFILLSPEGNHDPAAAKLRFPCTNNMAKYETCIFGLKMALEMEINDLIVFSDSDLLVHQTLKQLVTRDSKIMVYHCNLLSLANKFRSLEFRHIPHTRNVFADTLATLSSMIQYPDELKHLTIARDREHDCVDFVRTCIKCQMHADIIHAPPTELHSMIAPWSCSMWGVDVIGAIDPPASNRHRIILVAIEYFTKWVEAASYKNVIKKVVSNFLRDHIICRFGVLERLIIDNARNLNNDIIDGLCE
ncbi:uncharacterized protein LOC113751886 [Coffea eugenioides]|uniref:uncharacterized protein LOC113751886 n=1 Tax=Coffea eugenioides TaxID=49369 RepID=UPI000F609727|nr:uncharacterized protein LOC113751886 [Coffea eugenioides]